MNRKDRYFHIIKYFQENMPLAETELHYQNPYQLLVAVILSAQCTDRRVNATVPPLFQRYPDPQSLVHGHGAGFPAYRFPCRPQRLRSRPDPLLQ